MKLTPIFNLIKTDSILYSPLFGEIKFIQVRNIDVMNKQSPIVLEFKTLGTNSTILFNENGNPLIYHASGEMIYETNLGECMVYPNKETRSWKEFIENVMKSCEKKKR